jgi:hypothetical protein
MSNPNARTRTQRPIIHVNIIDDTPGAGQGRILADVDATSTADALAYYLVSRKLDLAATEDSIKLATWFAQSTDGEVMPEDTRIAWEQRDPITKVLERAVVAEAH